MNYADLKRILQSEIFLYQDRQFQAIHMILRFKPISKCFQSPKHVIKAKDLRLTLIDITVPKFLTEPPPPGTQDAGLLAQLAAKLLYSHE